MEKEKLEIVLEEVVEDSKNVRSAVEELKQEIWQLREKADDLEKKVDTMKVVPPPVDTRPVQTIVRVSLDRIQQLIADQPKTVVHQKRFLLFPEHHATEYYRIIFRLILWLTLASAVYYLFALGKEALQNAKEIRLRELQLTHAKDAIPLLYDPQKTEPIE